LPRCLLLFVQWPAEGPIIERNNMSSSAATRVFSGYRRLFRARKVLFKNDERALYESRFAIRAEFDKNRAVTPEGPHFEGLLSMVHEAEDMLLHGIVQGELNQNSGNYEVKIKPEHADAEQMTQMEPITEETVAKTMNPKVEVTKSSCSREKRD